MMKIVQTALLVTSFVARAHSSTELGGDCKVQAWVRAEDLAPNRISQGEMRIKVKPTHCANRVASVALRLQLDEFGEVKYLRRGAVLPEIHESDNQTVPSEYFDLFGGRNTDIVYDYGAYDRAMSDPAFWVVKGEERRAWSTEVVLFQNNPNFSEPRVTPFVVASPAVNYPPSVKGYRSSVDALQLLRRHAFSQLGYHYIAIVEFVNGTVIDLPVGYTEFGPASPPPPLNRPFTWNVTLGEDASLEPDLPGPRKDSADKQRCLPEELRSVFVAEVTLDEGNAVRRGQVLKGRVTVHATNGSTTMSGIIITLDPTTNNHWAATQAINGGDAEFDLVSQTHSRAWPMRFDYRDARIFDAESRPSRISYEAFPSRSSRLTVTKPYFDFDLPVPKTTMPDFSAFYGQTETFLELRLTAFYSRDAEICIRGVQSGLFDEDEPKSDAEDGLWDSFTPVGEPGEDYSRNSRALHLTGRVRINVLGDISSQPVPVDHYLKPGPLPSPVILASSQANVVFPVAQPITIVEPIANTSARLMVSGSFDPYQSRSDLYERLERAAHDGRDPFHRYATVQDVGLLWKKKIVAMERGILPSKAAEASQDYTDGQQALVGEPL